MKFPKLGFNSTTLKIIAMLVILIDHIGYMFAFNLPSDLVMNLRIIGRLGFPLYAFFIVEGVIHSKNTRNYLLRIFALFGLVLAFQIVAVITPLGASIGNISAAKNIFSTLLAGAMTIVYFEKKRWKDVYLLLPIIALIIINIVSVSTPGLWQLFLLNDYGLYGLIIILGFYLARVLTKPTIQYIAVQSQLDYQSIENDFLVRNTINVLSCVSLLIIHLVWYILSKTIGFIPSVGIQPFATFTGVIILLYNGNKGYSRPWFRWFYYLFYPAHLGLLALVSAIISFIK